MDYASSIRGLSPQSEQGQGCDYEFVVDYLDYETVVKSGGQVSVMAITGAVSSPESLGRILQQARLLTGLSQRELADQMGVSQRYIWEMEAGKPSKYTDRLFEMMRQTGMTLHDSIDPQTSED